MPDSSTPPSAIKVTVPRAVAWGWATSTIGGLALVIAYLIRLAFSLEADLVREQLQVGAMVAELKEVKDRVYHYETVVDSLSTRVAVLEADRRTK